MLKENPLDAVSNFGSWFRCPLNEAQSIQWFGIMNGSAYVLTTSPSLYCCLVKAEGEQVKPHLRTRHCRSL